MLKRRPSSRWGLSHWPPSSLHQSHSLGRLSTSDCDISYVHTSKIKLVQLNICTTKTKLDHYYSSRVDYRSVKSFLENSQLTWCIYSTVGDDSSSLRSRVHYTKLSSTRERRRSYPHDNSQDSSSLTFTTVGDGSYSFHSKVHCTKMSSTLEWRRSYPHDNSRDSSSSHIWWRFSLTDYSLTFATVGDGSFSFCSWVHYTKLSSTRETKEKLPPRQQSRFFALSYMVETRQT